MSFVQGATGNAVPCVIAFPGNNTAGNILVVVARIVAAGGPTIADTAGNTWVKDYESLVAASNTISVWHCINAKGGANTVTITAGGASFIRASVGEWTGNNGMNAVNASVLITTGTGVTATANAITTTKSDIMIACAIETTGTATQAVAGGGFTTREDTVGTQYDTVLADQIAAAGTYTATINFSISSTWGIVVLAFNSASPGFNLWKPQGTIFGTNLGAPSASVLGNATVIYDSSPQVLAGPNVFKCWIGSPYGGNTGNVNYYESADGVTGWTPYASNPVVAGGGSAANILPTVYKVGSTYYMYTGWGAAVGITVRTSSDGLAWSSHGTQIVQGGVGTWDHDTVNQLNICEITGGTWYGYYHGSNALNSPPSAAGLVTSTDGIVWTKDGSNPKITATNTTFGPGQSSFFKSGGTYYCYLSKEPDITASNTQLDTGGYVVMYLYSSPTPSGPWTQFKYNGTEVAAFYPSIPADFSVDTATIMDVTNASQVGDPAFARNCITDSNGLDISILGNIYLYYTISHSFGDETGTNMAVAYSTSPAQLVSQIPGIYNAPISGYTSLNLVTSVSDAGTGSNANPIAGNWTPLSTTGTFSTAQRASNKIEPSTAATSADSWYAGTGAVDQWSQVTVAACGAASYVGADVHMAIDGTQTAYRAYWNGTLGSPGTWNLQRIIAGAATTVPIKITNLTVSVGDTLALVSIQGNLMMYWNGYLLYSVQAIDLLSGSTGFMEFAVTAVTNSQISAWSSGVGTSGFQAAPSIAGTGGSFMQAFRQFANKKGGLS